MESGWLLPDPSETDNAGWMDADADVMSGFYAGAAGDGKSSFLTTRAIKSRPAGLDDPLNGSSAARRRTCGAFAVVNAKTVLEITERSIRLSMIAQGRAAGGERLLQDCADGRRQTGERRRRRAIRAHKGGAGALWRDA